MIYVQPQKSDLTSALKAGVHYWQRDDRIGFESDSAWNQIYAWMQDIQIGSVSWQTQYTDADRQLGRTFNKLTKKWKRETINISSIQQMVLHPSYQEIIAMGSKVIPLILNELKREPDFWFWALRALTKADPVTKGICGDLMSMTKAWLDWGRKHAYL